MDRLPAAAVAALIVIARGHETETSPHEAANFRHARRPAPKRGMEAYGDGEECLAEPARRGADESAAISAKLPGAARERAASFRSAVANGPKR